MIKYEVIIYWSKEDEEFIAEVPELPGCAADGSTYQEALANVEIVNESPRRNLPPVHPLDNGRTLAGGAARYLLTNFILFASRGGEPARPAGGLTLVRLWRINEWLETAAELGRPIPEPKGRLVFA